jgi:hypothetical protein
MSAAPPLPGGWFNVGTRSRGFTPGCHRTGFQPFDLRPASQHGIAYELKRLQGEG